MRRLTRDGTAETVSRDQILRHERGQGNIHFPCLAAHEQDYWQLYPVDISSIDLLQKKLNFPNFYDPKFGNGQAPRGRYLSISKFWKVRKFGKHAPAIKFVLTFFPHWGMLRRSRCVLIFL